MTQIKGRITAKKLIDWCNKEFERLEIKNYKVTDIFRTHYRLDDYECGACKLIVKFKDINLPDEHIINKGSFLCFYSMKEYEQYLKDGYQLYLRNKGRFGIISDFEIDVRK